MKNMFVGLELQRIDRIFVPLFKQLQIDVPLVLLISYSVCCVCVIIGLCNRAVRIDMISVRCVFFVADISLHFAERHTPTQPQCSLPKCMLGNGYLLVDT